MPNPFPLQNTAYSVNFNVNGPPLFEHDVRDCIGMAWEELLHDMIQSEETSISPFPRSFAYNHGTVHLSIRRAAANPNFVLSYGDIKKVLQAFLWKMDQEGFHRRSATIVITATGATVGRTVIARLLAES